MSAPNRIEKIETGIWQPRLDESGKPTGYLDYAGQRSVGDVLRDLEATLRAIRVADEGDPERSLYDALDYFHAYADRIREPFPRSRWVACFVVEGSCEGHYLHVEAIALIDENGRTTDRRELVILGKTFEGLERALEVCAVLTRLFHN